MQHLVVGGCFAPTTYQQMLVYIVTVHTTTACCLRCRIAACDVVGVIFSGLGSQLLLIGGQLAQWPRAWLLSSRDGPMESLRWGGASSRYSCKG